MSRVDVGRMRRQLERTQPPNVGKQKRHDRDRCSVCFEVRVRNLHSNGGLSADVAKQLIAAGQAASPTVTTLESATADQIKAVNAGVRAIHAGAKRVGDYIGVAVMQAGRAVPVGDRGQQT